MEAKPIPEDTTAEKAVLGAILLDNSSLKNILNILNDSDFYHEANKLIYRAMLSLYFHDEPIDMVTLTNYLRSRDKLQAVGGTSYIMSLNVVTSASIIYHAEIVKRKALSRKLIDVGKLIQELGYSDLDKDTIIDEAQHLVMQLSKPAYEAPSQEASLWDLFTACLNRIIGNNYVGIATGFPGLDALTNGLHIGSLVSIQGTYGCGKTALALQMMKHIAKGHKTTYVTENINEAALRIICVLANVSCWQFKTNRLQDLEWLRIQSVLNEPNGNINLCGFNGSNMELISNIREIYSKQKPEVLFLDLQTLSPTDSELMQKLRSLARELNIVIVLLFDTSRAPAAESNLCLMLTRKHKLIIGKQTGGPTGNIDLVFDDVLLTFNEKA